MVLADLLFGGPLDIRCVHSIKVGKIWVCLKGSRGFGALSSCCPRKWKSDLPHMRDTDYPGSEERPGHAQSVTTCAQGKKWAGNRITEQPQSALFSRKHSEGFPFIVGGLGVGSVFASCFSCRRGVVVVSCWPRRRQHVNSLPSGKALGGVFCGLLLLRPKTLIALSRLSEMAPTRVFSARTRRFCVAGAIDSHHLAASCCVFSANRIVSAAQSVTRCKFRGRRGIL